MHFDTIAFDADDTLWHSEIFYKENEAALCELIAPYGVESQALLDTLHRIEIDNLSPYGYGIKGFTLSMIEAAIEATAGKVSTKDILSILALGKAMAEHELRLLDYSHAAVAGLAETHTLMLVTKGDLMDQERKIAASGLAEYFRYVEIVSDKNPETYAGLLRKHGLRPEGFLMVGNSMRSDILPVLEMGGWAAYVPHELTWTHERRPAPVENKRFFEIEHLGALGELVEKIENGN